MLEIINKLCLEGNKPEIVYHLASNYLGTHKFNEIRDLIQSNITFGAEILDAMSENKMYNFVNTGTAFQHCDDADYKPFNFYAATKECFEKIINFYEESAGLRCINLHLFDTYGVGDTRGRILCLLKKFQKQAKR